MINKMILPSLLAGLLISSCQTDEVEIPADELYTREFVKQFGVSDPSQDWNFAGRLTATVNAADFPNGSTVYVYDRMPGAEGCQLSAKFSTKAGSFDFDFSRANSRAYVQVVDANGTSLLSSYLPITDSTLKIATSSKSRAGETPNVTLIDYSTWEGGNYAKGVCNEMKGAFPIYGFKTGGSQGNYYDLYLKGEYKDDFDDGRAVSDLVSILGKNGVFHEGATSGAGCNLSRHANELKPKDGVVYTAPHGEVTLEYIYGAAAFHNSFGYFYYRDDFTEEEILKAPKFVLMLDASPWANTKRQSLYSDSYEDWSNYERYSEYAANGASGWDSDGFTNYGGLLSSDDIKAWEEGKAQKDFKYKPSFHKLIYYPIKADKTYDFDNPTYTFDKGIKIGFFIMCHGYQKITRQGRQQNTRGDVLKNEFRFSLPWMNKHFGNMFDKSNHTEGFNDSDPLMSFVSYKWNGTSVMGVEDGAYGESDHDMNDILFFVHGVEDNSHNFETYPFAQSWVIACEDLGSTYDFDFNDMVFGVSYVATQDDDRRVYIRALAAGGTLPIELYRTDKNGVDVKINPGKSHWNHWFGGEYDASMVINATAGSVVNMGDEFSFDLEEGETFTLSSSMFREGDAKPMGGFKVKVNGKTWVHPIGTTGEYELAPQMILLPPTWKWPKEGVPVYEAYPGGYSAGGEPITSFSTWCKTSDYSKWSEMLPVDAHVVSHDWQGHKLTSSN